VPTLVVLDQGGMISFSFDDLLKYPAFHRFGYFVAATY